ncbi:uncharacterized protein LOC142217203 [Leptodactylus fuscus]|uniref:uncharacterized protein LOC142217203 n=1 Tax=Leptodactylus fuscus TaxID=238119 RepID=UPI003F4E5D0E
MREKSGDLFLISQEEKKSNYQRHLLVNREVERKLQSLRDIIRRWKTEHQTSIRAKAQDSSLIKQKEKTSNDQRRFTVNTEKGKRRPQGIGEKSENVRKWKTGLHLQFSSLPWSRKKSVGIFSRSSESEYSWLKRLLESEDLRNHVKHVQAHYVSNSFSKFCNDVSQCEFGILYHTKNRGRINVTDVTDSLYNEELKHLSSVLGKKNVVVVIDDLEDASDLAKERILSHQPSIRELAQDLILVMSSEEKMRAKKDAIKNLFTDNKQ